MLIQPSNLATHYEVPLLLRNSSLIKSRIGRQSKEQAEFYHKLFPESDFLDASNLGSEIRRDINLDADIYICKMHDCLSIMLVFLESQ
jgi:hypothetical protein